MKTPRTLLRLGMLFLVFFNLSTFAHRWLSPVWENWIDGFAGFAMGAAIVLIFRFVWLRGRLLRGHEIPPCS